MTTKLFVHLQASFLSFRSRLSEERGQPALEYVAIAVVVVATIVGGLAIFGDQVRDEVDGLFDEIFN